MMKQFFAMKAQHPEAVLLFRCGDFYETYGDDALTASKVLGIVLTKRSSATPGAIPMAGFPYHSLETYLPRLVRAGYKVAVCDQLEDPKLTKKIVKRGITELVTPGVAFNDQLLEQKSGIHVNVDKEPEMSVARGLARVMNEREFRPLAFVTKEQKYE